MLTCLLWATQKAHSNEVECIMNVAGASKEEAERTILYTSKWLGERYEQILATLTNVQDRLEAGKSVSGNELNNLLVIAQRFEPAIEIVSIFWRDGYELPENGLNVIREDIEADLQILAGGDSVTAA